MMSSSSSRSISTTTLFGFREDAFSALEDLEEAFDKAEEEEDLYFDEGFAETEEEELGLEKDLVE